MFTSGETHPAENTKMLKMFSENLVVSEFCTSSSVHLDEGAGSSSHRVDVLCVALSKRSIVANSIPPLYALFDRDPWSPSSAVKMTGQTKSDRSDRSDRGQTRSDRSDFLRLFPRTYDSKASKGSKMNENNINRCSSRLMVLIFAVGVRIHEFRHIG